MKKFAPLLLLILMSASRCEPEEPESEQALIEINFYSSADSTEFHPDSILNSIRYLERDATIFQKDSCCWLGAFLPFPETDSSTLIFQYRDSTEDTLRFYHKWKEISQGRKINLVFSEFSMEKCTFADSTWDLYIPEWTSFIDGQEYFSGSPVFSFYK